MKLMLKYVPIALAFIAIATAASSTSITAPYSAFTNWFPVLLIASLLAVLLAGVYYMIGYFLNNARIKSSAISEVEQAAGSIFLVVIIVAVLYLVVTSASISFSGLLGSHTSDFSKICNTYLKNNMVWMISSTQHDPATGLPYPTTAICQNLIGSNGPKASADQITTNIDYGLASTYVVIANMTNQSIFELNSIYNLESIIFFLRNLNPYIGVCFPVECIAPIIPRAESLQLSYKPFNGYVLHRTIMPTIATQAILSNYMMTLELVIILMLLLFWPYLLGAGIVLRTIPFTRRAGGLIIAATIVGVLILPTIFLIEYSALNNLVAQPAIGSSQIQGMALCGFGPVQGSNNADVLYCYTSANTLQTSYIYKNLQPQGWPATMNACTSVPTSEAKPFDSPPPCYVKKNLSLYAFPNAKDIITFYSCYPSSGTILPTEAEILLSTLVSSATIAVQGVLSLFASNFALGSNNLVSPFFSPTGGQSCISQMNPHNLVATLTSLTNMYGIISVAGFILPILNLLICLSAMTGISSIIGGETTIIGLSRFI